MKKKLVLVVLSMSMILGCTGCNLAPKKEDNSYDIQEQDTREEKEEEKTSEANQTETNEESSEVQEKELSEEDEQVIKLFDEVITAKKFDLTEEERTLLMNYQAKEVKENTIEGKWNRTDCENGLSGCATISKVGKELTIDGEFFSWAATGGVDGKDTQGYLLCENKGIVMEKILWEGESYGAFYFLEEKNGLLKIAQVGNGEYFGMGVSSAGIFTQEEPTYTNEHIMEETFDDNMQKRIKTLLEQNDIDVDNYFVTPVKYGILEISEGVEVTFADGSNKKGTWYDGIIPHDGYDYFSMFISEDDHIYFTTCLAESRFVSDDGTVSSMPEKKE